MIKNNVPASQINGTLMLPLEKLKPIFPAQKGNSCGASITNYALVTCPQPFPTTSMLI
jgi:hypothetical protein